MTRSDVINSLGAGSRLSQKAIHAARVIDRGNTNGNQGEKESMMDMENDAYDDDDSTCSEEDSVISTTSDESGNDAANDIAGIDINAALNGSDGRESDRKVIRVPAQAKDIGSFYAAICALGEEVEIGTKVSDDLESSLFCLRYIVFFSLLLLHIHFTDQKNPSNDISVQIR